MGKRCPRCGDDIVEDTPLQGNPTLWLSGRILRYHYVINMYMNLWTMRILPVCIFYKGQRTRMRAVLENFRKGC